VVATAEGVHDHGMVLIMVVVSLGGHTFVTAYLSGCLSFSFQGLLQEPEVKHGWLICPQKTVMVVPPQGPLSVCMLGNI
jgi:hypothetical protein